MSLKTDTLTFLEGVSPLRLLSLPWSPEGPQGLSCYPAGDEGVKVSTTAEYPDGQVPREAVDRAIKVTLGKLESDFFVEALTKSTPPQNVVEYHLGGVSRTLGYLASLPSSTVILCNARSFGLFRNMDEYAPEVLVTSLKRGYLGSLYGTPIYVNRCVPLDVIFFFDKGSVFLKENLPLEEEGTGVSERVSLYIDKKDTLFMVKIPPM